ncbi:MAG TPA: S9 family peptidase [Candidatus Polarisedimenticolaceae bacterium]|nr:S9 family peptidase [Candidatus Polarisedimenticolaceae bacterium]
MIPLEEFFRKPQRVQPRLAPGGRHLAYLEPYRGRLNVVVEDLATGATERVTEATERDVQGYLWANDERLLYAQDQGGDENYRLYAVSRDGTARLDLTPFEGVKCQVVDELEEDEHHVLFEMNRRDPQVFDVYRLDVRSGAMEAVAENPGNIDRWIPDHQGRVRLATTTDGVNTSLLYREHEGAPWRTLARHDFRQTVTPRLFTFDDRSAVVSSNVGRDTTAIAEYDLERARESRVLFEHPDVDAGDVMFSRKRRVLTGVTYETDRWHYRFFDAERERIQRFLEERLPGYDTGMVSRSRDERWMVFFAASDRSIGAYHLLDAERLTLRKLFDISPWLDERQMAEMRPIRYTSRDGWTIHGYLTLPPGLPPRELPLIVHPHGGPWSRDSWGFDPEAQFLASRGYATLQVNFRGSTGYGRRFWEAGFGQWGLAMQDDVTDGVRWAIEQGLADPRRIAIYGGSYGGYAALSGLTTTPELYACGISYVGVSNLFTWFAAFPPYWKPYLAMMHEMVGHPERDAERLRATSPLFAVDRIVAPLLVAQGANDPRVRQAESDQVVQALRGRGVEVEYLVKPDEGHGFQSEQNRFDFYRAMERFLAQHLGAGTGPRPAALG